MARRRSTIKPQRSVASEFPEPKSLELETRVARIEALVADLRDDCERRLAAIQAQLDHLVARVIRY